MTDKQVLTVSISYPDENTALTNARYFVEHRLAACAQCRDVISVYVWDGAVEQATETILDLKTTSNCFETLRAHIRKTHPYDVPQITAHEVTHIDPDYADWVRAQCGN